MNANNFSNKEKKEAKNNGFLLGGKTGSGKSTLLNVLFSEEKAIVKRSAKAVTEEPSAYYYKLKNGKCITIIDSPGLSDPKNIKEKNTDNLHLDKIIRLIKKEDIRIKGILFLVNFQGERFDSDEANALINYNKIFPLRKFWQHVLVIFTHHFSDPLGDTVEDMKKDRDSSNKEIFSEIMESIKGVSDVINYMDLKTKYFNSYWPIKPNMKEQQNKENEKNRNELENSLDELSLNEPLFSKIEIAKISGQIIQQNEKYYKADILIIGYFDLNNNKPIREEKSILSKIEIDDLSKIKNKPKIEYATYEGNIDEKNAVYIIEKLNHTDNYYRKQYTDLGLGGLIGATVGAAIGGAIILVNPVGLASVIAYGVGAVIGGGAAGGGILGGIGGFINSLFNK